MDYNEIYSKILNLEPQTRMVTVCDNDGKIVFSQHKEGVTNLLTPEESKRSLEMAVNAWKTRSQLANKIGKGKYVLAEYEKIKRITMPLDESHLLYVTTEASADHNKILEEIMKLR
jgi:predicted transcriptional regulator